LIVCFVDIDGTVDQQGLELIVCFVDIDGTVDQQGLELIVCFVDIGGNVDHHCVNFHFILCQQSIHI